MADLFDMKLRSLRRDKAARIGPELFLLERTFADCLERIELLDRPFERALMIGCPDGKWPSRLRLVASAVDVRDPGPMFVRKADGEAIIEDRWDAPSEAYDLVLAIGTLDTVNDLPLALRLVRYSMQPDSMFMGAMSGGETLPQLRAAMRAADGGQGAAPHVHPRIEPSALPPLLADAGFTAPVVDIDRVDVTYTRIDRLIADLRAMGATNVLNARPRRLTRAQYQAAASAFAAAGDSERTTETFEILHFATWTPKEMMRR